MNLTLDAPWWLLALAPVGWVAVLLFQRQRRPAMIFSSVSLFEGVPITFWQRIQWLPDALRISMLTLVVLALARPQAVGEAQVGDAEGIDIIVALDTSGSMRAVDFQPNDRMFVAKKSVEQFVRSRTVDRIGLVVFAGEAATWVPLTLDYSLVAEMLNEVEVGMLPDGTAIGTALGTALNRLRQSDATSRVVVLLTDGDNNAGNVSPKKAADFAQTLGVRVYTVLIGQGGPVPFPAGKDMFGRAVYRTQVMPINPALLRELAQTTGGEAFEAKDGQELDARLTEILDHLDRSRLEATTYAAPKTELFPYCLGLALGLLGIELLLSSTRLRRFP